jgi:hypothetical protein
MHPLIRYFTIGLLLLSAQLFAQSTLRTYVSKELFTQQLLFVESTAFSTTELLIAQIVSADSLHPADTIYMDTLPLSMCDTWELDRNVSCGVWELHNDTLTIWYHSHKTFGSDAGYLETPEERTWKKTYVIRKNMEIVLLSTGYGQTALGIANKNLNQEILRKTKSAYREVGRLCY